MEPRTAPELRRAFSECRQHIRKPPSQYLKQFYYDTVNFDPHALQLAIASAGADHIVAGSDYPHQIGSLKQMVTSVEGMNLPEDKKAKIRWKNAPGLLRLESRPIRAQHVNSQESSLGTWKDGRDPTEPQPFGSGQQCAVQRGRYSTWRPLAHAPGCACASARKCASGTG